MRKYILFFFLIPALFIAFLWNPENTEKSSAAASEQYTENELQSWSDALYQNIDTVIETTAKGKTTRAQKLLGFEGKTTYFYDPQKIIFRLMFTFPSHVEWNEAANRISEQLGEPSFTALYENGSAASEWINDQILYALSSDGKIMTLTAAKYYPNGN
ncbi:MAG: hypothetical protein ACI3W6_04340 [Clostridia bacterium]